MSNLNFEQEQRSMAWHRDRLGIITGSKVGVLMKSGRTKGETFSATAKTYLCQLAGERALSPAIVGDDDMLMFFLDQTTSQSKAMRFGTEQEDSARAIYADISGREVKEVGLCHHKTITHLASSPDGVTIDGGVLGCIEIKCPTLATFAQYVAEVTDNDSLKRINPHYFYQCQNHMACTDGQFCDFVVYCPFVVNPIHVVRIVRDEAEIALIEERVSLAEEVVESYRTHLNQ